MAQSQWQLRQKYKEDADTIKGNCENWIFLTSRELDLLKDVSTLCGDTFLKDSIGVQRTYPLISVSELQRLKKELGEALILHGRNYPFVTHLPDIDDYGFLKFPTIKSVEKEMPKIKLYNSDASINTIIKKERPIPFSLEVYGEPVYYNDVYNPALLRNYT